ncbi:MAG: cytochrome c-type biogenesis protein CcmH, partial [Mobilicoccus sp.]|nr:cytochrome c-type biogenesis protein CcmH [Mobilicoccus sp.]
MSTATRPPETSPLAAARAPGRLRGVLLVLALLVAVGGLVLAAVTDTPTSAEDDVREVAASLRCLACAGEDVANSTAPLAESMRLVIAEQRAAGRSPEQIREWFVSRYGPEVLLDPPRYDVGLLLWIAPLLVVAGAAGAVVWRTRTGPSRGRSLLVAVTAALVCVAVMLGAWAATTALRASPPTPPAATDAGDTPGATRVLHDAVGQDPANTRLRTALATRLETEQRYAEAAEQYAALGRLR